MTKLKIKPEYKDVQIGFNGSGLPLGLRNDLDVLAKIAKEGNDQSILNMFETIPEEKELLEMQGEKFIATTSNETEKDVKPKK